MIMPPDIWRSLLRLFDESDVIFTLLGAEKNILLSEFRLKRLVWG
jgi:hypothetical protein